MRKKVISWHHRLSTHSERKCNWVRFIAEDVGNNKKVTNLPKRGKLKSQGVSREERVYGGISRCIQNERESSYITVVLY